MYRIVTAASNYDDHVFVNHGKRKFSVYISNVSDPSNLRCQVSESRAYDDADYAWASLQGDGQVKFIKNQKIISKMRIEPYDSEAYESPEEYVDMIVDDICVALIDVNRNVKPRIMHN